MTDDDGRPQLKAPPGACDTHMHIYDHRYPKAATARIDPPDAPIADYLAMRARLGIERTVVVQPSTYGKDNRCTLEAMGAIGPSARGVVVLDESVTDDELTRLTKLGVRGVRFFMFPGGPLPWDILETMAARIAPFGWHIVFQTNGRELADRAALLHKLAAPVVIDHVGKFIEPVEPDHPGFRALLRLLDNGRTWIKLAAPYETSMRGPPYYDDVGRLAKILAKTAPDRTLWACNWPHPMAGERTPQDAWMLDMLLNWVPDDAARAKVLVDNPAKLYGF
jgi:D-galactarolactone isomerase